MKAIQFTAINALAVAEVAIPQAVRGEALVRVKAAALNHRDIWIKLGQYADVKFPSRPGSDGAGVVELVGPDGDPQWIGREVIINPSFGWGNNQQVQGDHFTILGLPRDGTLAEFIAVPISQLTAKPLHLSWAEAAALPLAGLTAYRALLSRAQLKPGEKILISGIGGGVAVFALQFALAHGAEVYVTSSSDDKIARAVALGAKGGFNYTHPNWAKTAVTFGHAFNVVIDSSGGEGFESLVDLTAPGGRIAFFGATSGNPPVLPMRKIFWRQISLLGTTMGSPMDWTAMVDFVSTHRITPIVSDIYPFEQVAKAFALMEVGGQFGKIVLTP